ncbi:hypothetical protein LAWI1_G006884 [Lachnellula willkommii]|uniref:Uncharacterized protein n=1 Tax=Lachnellula willkommii TaxID=215461 RepID=A0A559M1Y3_9HELO|nr:hypothetical protein LAWI1_G006884 [Lachnellula willkommii]
MPSNKKFLKAEDFEKALKRLDKEMSKDNFLAAFAPINIVTIGGFLAETYYIIDPQWAQDDEIKVPLKMAINSVAKKENFEGDWMNDGLHIWASAEASKTIFEQAYKQGILLFDSESLKVWAAPFEWALERKVRRVAYSDRGDKKVDMEDALALFKHFRKANGGPLDMEYFRKLNINGFDMNPETHHMEMVAANYRYMYKEDLFSSSTIQEPSSTSYSTVPAESKLGAWSDWVWSEELECKYRSRKNAAEPNGFEYDYDTTTATTATPAAGPSQPASLSAAPAGPSQLAETSQEFPLKYYYVRDGEYYLNDNGKVDPCERPSHKLVYNENGWKDTQRRKKWRYAGKQVSYK